MNANSRLRRLALPAAGVALLLALVVQARAVQTGARARAGAPVAAAGPGPAGAPWATGGVAAEGRLVAYPGADVTLSVDLPGTIARLPVAEKSRVRRGQLLAALRADDLAAERAEALARRNEADADLQLFEVETARARNLLAKGDGTQQGLDRARRDRDAALARRATAEASLARIDAQLAKSRVVSPIDGVVLARDVEPGEGVSAGQPLLRVADLARVRVEAEVNEFDAGRIRLGAPVEISAEGYDGQSWRGRVEEIPDAVVARNVKPEDPARPVDTRVLLVKIALDGPTPLKLGQRVEARIAAAADAPATASPGR